LPLLQKDRGRAAQRSLAPSRRVSGIARHGVRQRTYRSNAGLYADVIPKDIHMSTDLAYAILLIQQRQARDLSQQHRLQQLFLTFVDGQLSAEEYERSLELAARERVLHAR
jgi:hypothetical protein